MPKRARVFVAEDKLDVQEILEGNLRRAGHSVVLKATSLEDALKAIQQFRELGVQVATIDGNFDPNDTSGDDGRTLLEAIRSNTPDVKTIGMSNKSIPGVDVDLGKGNYTQLGGVVTKL